MRVLKFGGTSVQDSTAINATAEIVRSKLAHAPLVVVSALARVTDGLLRIAKTAEERRHADPGPAIAELRERHLATARELLSGGRESLEEVEGEIKKRFADLEGLVRSIATLGELTPRSQDAISSFGE